MIEVAAWVIVISAAGNALLMIVGAVFYVMERRERAAYAKRIQQRMPAAQSTAYKWNRKP